MKTKRTIIKDIIKDMLQYATRDHVNQKWEVPPEKIKECAERIVDLYKRKPRGANIGIEKSEIKDDFVLDIIRRMEGRVGKQLSIDQIVVEYYKTIKGFVHAPGWDTLNFLVHRRLAIELLKAVGLDTFRIIEWFSKNMRYWDLFKIRRSYHCYYTALHKQTQTKKEQDDIIGKYSGCQ